MNRVVFSRHRVLLGVGLLLLAWTGDMVPTRANPSGPTVAQGAATFNSSGSQLTIHQTSANALINWQRFNIGAGETTTFVQPSSSAVAWNRINDPNPSQILGTLNANGYVILQNSSGFYVGGQASISTHGLILTTASPPAANLFSSGAWEFDAPPPTAKIINYGQINITGGGSAFLIANDIENNGSITAPGGNIGLYAGEKVLVSTSPDGRGLSAVATLPKGSVDNNGHLIADGGQIALHAEMVNQDGLIQANSAKEVNGTIELVASDNLKLGPHSTLSAQGDSTSASPGGFVVVKSGNSFADQSGSSLSVAGHAGGQDGVAEIFDPGANSRPLHTSFVGGYYAYLLNPNNLYLSTDTKDTSSSNPNLNVNDLSAYSRIDLQALDNISFQSPLTQSSTLWSLADSTDPGAILSLTAGNNIVLPTDRLGNSAAIDAGKNWNLSLTAGAAFTGTAPIAGQDGIYLDNGSYLQTRNGDIHLNAANEVRVDGGIGGGIRTIAGGNIDVTARLGDVNSGTSTSGYSYLAAAPYYTPFQVTGPSSINYSHTLLGGISTAAGGNVTINAGGDVISFPTTTVAAGDPGSGAFGPELGDVTVNAGGSVYGHFVEANGTGTINAGQNIGTARKNVALSLVKGSWNLNAGWDPASGSVGSGVGDIYLQEVRNPNGVFNNTTAGFGFHRDPSPGNHLFDYDPQASVTLTAGNKVDLTGTGLPRPNGAVPLLLPPTLTIHAGPGGVVLQTPTAAESDVTLSDYDITLFPSPEGELQILTTDGGGLSGGNPDGSTPTLLMSDSGQTHWSNPLSGPQPFSETDHASTPPEWHHTKPVNINVDGTMQNVALQVSKSARIAVGGDMIGCSFYGENLGVNDVTSIDVKGQIRNAGSFNSVTLDEGLPVLPLQDLPLGTVNAWYQALLEAVDPARLPTQSLQGLDASQLADYISNARLFPDLYLGNLAYNPQTKTLTAIGQLPDALRNALEQPTLTVVRYGPNGRPLLDSNGHLVTDTIDWVPGGSGNASKISSLYAASQGAPALGASAGAYVVGGTGRFEINAGSISLGNSRGILSVGSGGTPTSLFVGRDYSYLAPYIDSGATIQVTAGTLQMASSTIAALGGGDVNVNCTGVNSDGVSMDLGSQELVPFEDLIMNGPKGSNIGLGIYSSGGGNVNVTANGTIHIDSSRIASFNGGNVTVLSQHGDVNAGSGGAVAIPVNVFSPGMTTLKEPVEYVYANGIAATTLAPAVDGSTVPGAATLPGDISVTTPEGDIIASLGGILQETLNGTLLPGPKVTLTAGTPGAGGWNSSDQPIHVGNVDLGQSGVIGGTVIVAATGKVKGLLISQQDAQVQAVESFSGTILSGGTANLSSGGSISGTIVGASGVNASGGAGVSANILSQNASVNGGAAQSTLGTSATATTASQSAAGQTSDETHQQVANNGSDQGKQKKKKKKKPVLVRSVKRVTVILPTAS